MTKHSHYFKPVAGLQHIDVYRVLQLFGVTDQALGHAIKKLLVAGGRGTKDIGQDVQEAIDTLERWKRMQIEDCAMLDAAKRAAEVEKAVNIILNSEPAAAIEDESPRMQAIGQNGNDGAVYSELDRLQVAAAFNDDIPAEHCLEMVSKVAAQAREPERPRHLCATCSQGHATHECKAGLGGER